MFGMSMQEIILILAVVLIVIGPKKLPDLAKSLGRAFGEFKKATNDFKESISMDSTLNEVKDEFKDLGKKVKDPLSSSSAEDKNASKDEVATETKKPEETGTDTDPKTSVPETSSTAETESTDSEPSETENAADSDTQPVSDDSTPSPADTGSESDAGTVKTSEAGEQPPDATSPAATTEGPLKDA